MGNPNPGEFYAERKLLHLSILRARNNVYLTYCSPEEDVTEGVGNYRNAVQRNGRLATRAGEAIGGPSTLLSDVRDLLH